MGYKLHKIPKNKIINKIPETDEIFDNVSDEMESALKSNNEVYGAPVGNFRCFFFEKI